jgi:hypothetical protein
MFVQEKADRGADNLIGRVAHGVQTVAQDVHQGVVEAGQNISRGLHQVFGGTGPQGATANPINPPANLSPPARQMSEIFNQVKDRPIGQAIRTLAPGIPTFMPLESSLRSFGIDPNRDTLGTLVNRPNFDLPMVISGLRSHGIDVPGLKGHERRSSS